MTGGALVTAGSRLVTVCLFWRQTNRFHSGDLAGAGAREPKGEERKGKGAEGGHERG